MTDTFNPAAKPALGVGNILGESFGLFFRNFIPMTVIALIPVSIGIVLNLTLIGVGAQEDAMLNPDPDALGEFYLQMLGPLILSGIIGLILWGLAAAAITRAAYDAKTGKPVSIGASLSAGVQNLVPVVICMFVAAIAVYLGLIALLIPGLLLAAVWFVVIPAIVVERAGFGSFGRSARLTKEYRWPIIGLFALFLLIIVVASALVGGIAGAVALSGSMSGFFVVNMIVNAVVSVVTYSVGGSMAALVYARLREIKEGTGMTALAEVFS